MGTPPRFAGPRTPELIDSLAALHPMLPADQAHTVANAAMRLAELSSAIAHIAHLLPRLRDRQDQSLRGRAAREALQTMIEEVAG